MKEWLKYFTKREKIDITDSEIKDYIDAYGSNISNVMNYIRIDSIQEKLINLLIVFVTTSLFFVLTYGIVRGGSRRWVDLGLINFQPSEIAKPLII